MKEKREQGKKAFIRNEKLIVDGKEYITREVGSDNQEASNILEKTRPTTSDKNKDKKKIENTQMKKKI